VTVRPDGRFSFALVGEIEAAGQTPPQLQETMVAALAEYIDVLPGEVSVIVDSVHSYTVSVLGEVRLPGRFEFRNQVTVLDALAQAGGLTEFADTSDILILRTYRGQEERIRFNYKKSVRIDDNDPRVLLMPGDVVVVP
jgi:polysaccharide export outer membrane protein